MMDPIPTTSGKLSGARDQLMDDLRSVIRDAEAWLRHGGQLTGEEFQAAKAKFERTLSAAKDDLVRLEETVVEKTKEAAKATDDFVKENPWKAVGLGAAVGVVIGMLIARK
jgi:ElaB/YqjD/DUF883 family membrane-anchored ribosome-binding protein